MKKIIIMGVLLLLFASCNRFFIKRDSETIKSLKYELSQGQTYSELNVPDDIILDDVRSFSITDNYIYLLLGKERELLLFDNLGNLIKQVETIKTDTGEETFTYPTGLAYIPTNNVLVILDSMKGTLEMLNPIGNYLKTIYTFDYLNENEANYPSYISYDNKKNLILIVDTYKNQIMGIDIEGKIRLEIGANNNIFHLPQCITVDDEGRYYVGDKNGIKVFNAEGKFLYGFPKKGNPKFKKITDIAIWKDQFIVVAAPLDGALYFYKKNGEFLYKYKNGEIAKPYKLLISNTQKLYILDYDSGDIYVF